MAVYRIFTNDRGAKNGIPMYSCLKVVNASSPEAAKKKCPPQFDLPHFAAAVAIRWPESVSQKGEYVRHGRGVSGCGGGSQGTLPFDGTIIPGPSFPGDSVAMNGKRGPSLTRPSFDFNRMTSGDGSKNTLGRRFKMTFDLTPEEFAVARSADPVSKTPLPTPDIESTSWRVENGYRWDGS